MQRTISSTADAASFAIQVGSASGCRLLEEAKLAIEVKPDQVHYFKDGTIRRFWRVTIGLQPDLSHGLISGLPDTLDTLVTSSGRVFHWPKTNAELQILFDFDDAERAWNEIVPVKKVETESHIKPITGNYLDEIFRQQMEQFKKIEGHQSH